MSTAACSPADARQHALDLLLVETADAWFEYGEACRQARTGETLRYEEVEPWAWNRLQQRLRAIATRRRKLEP